jgi:two-component system sensor histidine kinase FlrB
MTFVPEPLRRPAAPALPPARLAALVDALPAGLLLVDDDGRIEQANAAAVALLGPELIGAGWNEVRDSRFTTLPGQQGDLLLGDGRQLSLGRGPLRPGPGQALLLTDVTKSRRIDDLLARHRRLSATGEMAATLAHQVRTPLAAALLYATNAAQPELPGAQRDDLLGKAVACLQELEHLVGDMLQFARGARLVSARFTLQELLDSVENALRPVLLPGQELSIEGPQADFPLNGNRETLASAVINLATNALDAAGASGHVQIVARESGLQAEIFVVDDGPGIAADLRDRIFDPFFTSRSDGTGLGLSLARSIAHAHRGDVVLVDGNAGGTTFALRLPLAAALPDELQQRNAAA